MLRLIIPMLLAAVPAFGHDWYHYECCNDKDCRPIPSSAVKATKDGYYVTINGRTMAYSSPKLKRSQDDQFHLCTIGGKDDGLMLCLYAPEQLF